MSLTAAPVSLDVVHGFLRAIGYDPDKVEEVQFDSYYLDVVVTTEDGCSKNTRHRLVENPVAAVVWDAVAQAALGKRVAVLFNSNAEAHVVNRALYEKRGSVLEGISHTFYLSARTLTLNDTGGSVDFVTVSGTSYRGKTWDLAYHPAELPTSIMRDVIPAVPSGRLIPY